MPSDSAGPSESELPGEVAALRALIAAQSAEIAAQQARLAEALAERDAQRTELAAARAGLIEQPMRAAGPAGARPAGSVRPLVGETARAD